MALWKMLFGSGTRVFGQSRYRIRSRSQRDHPATLHALVRPSARTSQPCSDFSNPNKVRPISGGNKSCALNSLDMALSLDDQVHVPAPKLRKNLNKEKRHRSTASTSSPSTTSLGRGRFGVYRMLLLQHSTARSARPLLAFDPHQMRSPVSIPAACFLRHKPVSVDSFLHTQS